ncbi:hypothetical protein VQ056_04125 [Paenibacillus sp. JTLBN-2024]
MKLHPAQPVANPATAIGGAGSGKKGLIRSGSFRNFLPTFTF